MLECFVRKTIAFTACAVSAVALITGCATSTGGIGGTGNFNAGGNSNVGGQGQNGGGSGNTVGVGGNTSGTGGTTSVGTPGGGFLVTDTWWGWAWTAVGGGATITPTKFTSAKAGDPLCVSGSVPSTADYSGIAMLGWNLNQLKAANSPANTVTPTLTGVVLSVTNTGGSPLRLQIQGPNGSTDATDRWCANVSGNGGYIPFSSFNTKCWDNSGAAYAGQPLTAALLIVPGSNTAAIPFNFCLNSLVESNDPNSSGGGTGCDITGAVGTGTGTVTGTNVAYVARDSRNYIIQNNVYNGNAGNQVLSYNGVSFNVTTQNNSASTAGAPEGFPDVFVGSNFGHSTTGTGLPKQVSSLTSVQTGWSISNPMNGTFNAAYDVWFSTNAGGDSGNPSAGYLMVWFYKPPNAQPLSNNGQVTSPGQTVGGSAWDIWVGTNNGHPVISYVKSAGITSLSFDLNDFIKDAVGRGVLQNSWYLTNVFAGFEIWSGGVGLKTNNFCVVVK